MRCTLLSLPFQDPSTPPLGLALLSAALKERGVDHGIVDANLDFLHFIELGDWGDGTAWMPFNPAHAENAVEYLHGFRRQQTMLLKLGEAYPDYLFTPYQLATATGWPDLETLKRIALSPQGIWAHWMERSGILERIMNTHPDWIGLSVNFDGQLPAAMALGHKLRQDCGVTVIWGGGLVNAFAHLLAPTTPIWDCADGVVLGAGEAMVCGMKERRGRFSPENAISLPGAGWIARSPVREPCRRPCFAAFPLRRYRAAGIVLPYRVFAHCHWGKCAFCADDRYHFHDDRLGGDPQLVAEELATFEERYGARGIYFLDAELPGAFMSDMAQALCSLGSTLRWGGNSRLSERLADPTVAQRLYRGGCRFLRFGLESGSNNILRAMTKGTTVQMGARVVRSISAAGIGVHVYIIRGFPGETPEDSEQTEEFLRREKNSVDSCNVSTFELYEGAPLMKTLPKTTIVRTANPSYWSYPKLVGEHSDANACREIEERFFANKKRTRCFPTLADSILLSDRFTLSYGA